MSVSHKAVSSPMDYLGGSNFTAPEVQSYSSSPTAPGLLILAMLAAYVTYKDYSGFLSLGPGGTPSTFAGYMKITFLRLFALRHPRCPAPIPEELQNSGFLRPGSIPVRRSARPDVAGIAPHRQTNQWPSPEVFNELSASIMKLAKDYPSKFRIATSAFEKHCPGLFSNKKANPEGNGEVCHAHPSDGSMHMTLHPEDIKIVIEAGWGGKLFSDPTLRHVHPYGFHIYAYQTPYTCMPMVGLESEC